MVFYVFSHHFAAQGHLGHTVFKGKRASVLWRNHNAACKAIGIADFALGIVDAKHAVFNIIGAVIKPIAVVNHLATRVDDGMGLVAKAQQMHGVIAMDRLVMVGIGAELARADGKSIGLVFALKYFVA